MLDLDCRVREVGDVTLVGAVVESSAPTPRKIRVESTLEGPIWAPRRDGLPERGWDDDGFEGVVPAEGRLAFGFASPAEPTEPPLFVVDHERASPHDSGNPADRSLRPDHHEAGSPPVVPEATPTGVLRALASPTPPRDVVPDPGTAGTPGSKSPSPSTEPDQPPAEGRHPDDHPPEPVTEWLETVEGRVRRAEALADAERLTAAARELERTGGLADAERLVRTLERDERALRVLARRAERLADRAAGADVPLSSFRRLA